jgi:hypothetical protein
MSVLPPDLQRNTAALAAAIRDRSNPSALTLRFRELAASQPVATIARCCDDLRAIANMHRLYHRQPSALAQLFLKTGFVPVPELQRFFDALARCPASGFFLLFHGDGRIREAALRALRSPPASAFELAAIVVRLNDWDGHVRKAAFDYAEAFLLQTAPEAVAEAALFLVPYAGGLGRAQDGKLEALLSRVVYREPVFERLVARLCERPQGQISRALRALLRKPGFDHHLPALARHAQLPSVREVAYDTLIFKRTKWFAGYESVWVDKVYGLTRNVARFGERAIDHGLDIGTLVGEAAMDRAGRVRVVAAEGLIANLPAADAAMDDLARRLSGDRIAAVRSRADYYLRQRTPG